MRAPLLASSPASPPSPPRSCPPDLLFLSVVHVYSLPAARPDPVMAAKALSDSNLAEAAVAWLASVGYRPTVRCVPFSFCMCEWGGCLLLGWVCV